MKYFFCAKFSSVLCSEARLGNMFDVRSLSIVARCRYVTVTPSLHPLLLLLLLQPPQTFLSGLSAPSFLPLIVWALWAAGYSVWVLWLPNHREFSALTECFVNNLMTIMVAPGVGRADPSEKPTTTRPLLWTNSLPRKNRRNPGEFGFYERTESCYVSL